MEQLGQIASRIIKSQEEIIGPVALEQARKVSGLEVSSIENVKITGNGKDVLKHLVQQYEKLFGRASIEVCRQAVREAKIDLPKDQLPDILQ